MEEILTIQELRIVIEKDYNAYYKFIFNIAEKFLKNYHNAEELTSDIFNKIWTNDNIVFKEKINIKGWLRTVTFNEFLSQYSKKKTLKHYISIGNFPINEADETNVKTVESLFSIADENPYNDVVYKELIKLIKSKLNKDQLFYFEKRFILGKSYIQMMQEADVTEPIVKNKIHSLRKRIIEILKENNYSL